MVAPYDHVRLKTTFRIGTEADRDQPWYDEERQTLLRSGPLARLHARDRQYETARLAHPDHSIRVGRNLTPAIGPWTSPEEPRDTRLESYRRALGRIDWSANNHGFLALHGGAALLEYPRHFKEYGLPADFEVARLEAATVAGHPVMTLGLRTSPAVPEKDRQSHTLVFAVDDSYVARSMRYEFPTRPASVTECQYDHPDGRPVLRSLVATIPLKAANQSRTLRVDVEECRFGPIPAAEFALEPFLASLQPGEFVRPPLAEPSTGTVLDWYWLALGGGGISLAGGAALALGSRSRDRRALRAG